MITSCSIRRVAFADMLDGCETKRSTASEESTSRPRAQSNDPRRGGQRKANDAPNEQGRGEQTAQAGQKKAELRCSAGMKFWVQVCTARAGPPTSARTPNIKTSNTKGAP